jgi:two-component system response regulator MprA
VRKLVIDDDDAVRSAVRRALLLDGFDVSVAPSGQEGLDATTTNMPDAVVLDLGLPDIDGMEVCRRVRSAGDRTPILMLTAHDAVEDRAPLRLPSRRSPTAASRLASEGGRAACAEPRGDADGDDHPLRRAGESGVPPGAESPRAGCRARAARRLLTLWISSSAR